VPSSRSILATADATAACATTAHHPQQQQRLQHLLLPYEQRLLLPNSCGLTGQQLNLRPLSGATQASGKAAAAAAARRASARPWGRGLRGSSAAAAAGAAAAGASGAFGAGIGQSTNAQNTGELGLPIDGMEGIAGKMLRLWLNALTVYVSSCLLRSAVCDP
jgi:hypothetical protein